MEASHQLRAPDPDLQARPSVGVRCRRFGRGLGCHVESGNTMENYLECKDLLVLISVSKFGKLKMFAKFCQNCYTLAKFQTSLAIFGLFEYLPLF